MIFILTFIKNGSKKQEKNFFNNSCESWKTA